MLQPVPHTLEVLLEAQSVGARDQAWTVFLTEFSDLIRYVCRQLGGDEDVAMDRYTFVLGALRENDFRRLRRFQAGPRSKFSTWLVAVTRRLCVDEYRQRYGRPQSEAAEERRGTRRNLADLVGSEMALDGLESTDEAADVAIERKEQLEALAAALERLPVPQRLLLRFRFEDGLSVPEIARMTGRSSPFALYREMDRVLERLRGELAGIGVEP